MKRSAARKRRLDKLRSSFGIRAYIAGYMFLLLAIVLLVIAVFQSFFLGVVYEKVREHDMEAAANRVADSINSTNLSDVVYEEATERLISILVYRIDEDRAVKILEENAAAGGGGQSIFISPKHMAELYLRAKEEGGIYRSQVTLGGDEVEQSFLQKLFPEVVGSADSFVTAEMLNMVHVRLCEDVGGNQYMILINTALAPLSPTVNTLQRQFIHIFFILVGLVLILVFPLSKRISRPIIHMNEAAKQLATGNYEADFIEENGYRETRELAESLNHAAQELSRADQLQKDLIANISHDLRTPLTMIRGYSEAMRDIPGENTPENLQVLIDETEHLSELVNDLLDLSKIQSGVRNPVMEFFDLTGAVREVMSRYEAFTKGKGYRIRLEAERGVPVFADRSMILQVVYNLINNAINYTGDDLTVTVVQTVTNGTVRLSVTDSGEGIPEEQLPLIWDRYYKVDRVHRSARVGSGLGLSIAKGVLEAHNAHYGVESTLGKGSTFWFELPISEPPAHIASGSDQ